ncbi:hypothetical protein [Paraburkholderia caledonica]|uniref:hypothetical protein n=1 Tax=Paraburkholderia caledonica TaxID=134536 RepID=UPI0038BBECE7
MKQEVVKLAPALAPRSDARLACKHENDALHEQVVSAMLARRELSHSLRYDLVCFSTALSAW